MDKTVILFNPSAGRGRAAGRRDALAVRLRGLGVRFEIIVTESEARLRTLTRRLAAEIGGGILAGAGGDSTFSIMAGEIVRSGVGPDVRFGMIGLGSSNDIPAAFGLGTVEAACAALARGRTLRIDAGAVATKARETGGWLEAISPGSSRSAEEPRRDTAPESDAAKPPEPTPPSGSGGAAPESGRAREDAGAPRPAENPAEGTIFLGQANVGLGAFVNRYVEELGARHPALAKHQFLAGVRGVRAAYRRGAVPLSLRIETASGIVAGEFDVAVFGNTRLWATGRAVVPEADPGDGRLDACLIRHSSFLRLVRIARLSRRGRHGQDARVSFLRAAAFRIVSDRAFAVQADGEIVGGSGRPGDYREVTIQTLPGALTLVA